MKCDIFLQIQEVLLSCPSTWSSMESDGREERIVTVTQSQMNSLVYMTTRSKSDTLELFTELLNHLLLGNWENIKWMDGPNSLSLALGCLVNTVPYKLSLLGIRLHDTGGRFGHTSVPPTPSSS